MKECRILMFPYSNDWVDCRGTLTKVIISKKENLYVYNFPRIEKEIEAWIAQGWTIEQMTSSEQAYHFLMVRKKNN